MSDSPLSVAIVGAGRIAGGYDEDRFAGEEGVYTHAGAYRAAGGFALALVCDIDTTRARNFAETWDVAGSTGDLDDVLSGRFDIVSVCTPDDTHFSIIRSLIESGCCRIVFAEKPLCGRADEIAELISLSESKGVALVTNFQRRFDPIYSELAEAAEKRKVITANLYYVKGLQHNGITAIDTLDALFGAPDATLAFGRTGGGTGGEESYEFVLYYDGFNVTVKTADSQTKGTIYHVFEIDILFDDCRVIIKNNSRQLERRMTADFAYSGVQVLDDSNPTTTETEFDRSMTAAVQYLKALAGGAPHRINTPGAALRVQRVADAVRASFERGEKIDLRAAS